MPNQLNACNLNKAICETLSTSRLEDAFRALWQFCECEMGWEFFRAEFEISDDPRQTLQNAKKLRAYLKGMKSVPAVAECLGANDKE